MPEDTARIVSATPVEMVTDGACLTGTLDQLRIGVAAKPMPDVAIDKVRIDAINLLARVLETYCVRVAPREVGVGGSGKASAAEPIARSPTGLLYGRVQSGKTAA